MTEQLVMSALRRRETAVFDTFYPEQHQDIVVSLKNMLAEKNDQFIYLWGIAGTGKTHLSQACCEQAGHLNLSSMFIALNELSPADVGIFEALEMYDVICLDDLDAIAQKPEWEEAVFHFFNKFKENSGKLIVTASHSPRDIPIQLPDLKSRLQGGLCFYLHPLSEFGKRQALVLAANKRGFNLPNPVLEYLLHHCSRDTQALFALLDKLDEATLVEGKTLSVPFVKKVLKG